MASNVKCTAQEHSCIRCLNLFFIPASQQSGIINPWMWMAAHTHWAAVRIFLSVPGIQTALKFPFLANFQAFCYTVKEQKIETLSQTLMQTVMLFVPEMSNVQVCQTLTEWL